MCAGLVSQDFNQAQDLRSLQAMARWMIRFSPVVALEPPDAVFLDVTGSERLFHGYPRLV